MANLTHFELIRYNRHLILKDFGEVAQLKLKNASVLVVGAGGLGSPALLYLTAAGVGTLGIIDFDTVDLSNLQRQVIFTAYDVGKNKAEAASIQLSKRNPLVLLKTYSEKLTSFNALDLIKDYDVVIDGTDNFPTRYLINDACVLLNKPFVYGSILTYEGQVSVFNYLDGSGDFSANYRDLFPEPPDPSTVQNCEEAGVLGVLPGIIGTLQANEVIKIITGIGEVLSNKLLLFDSLTLQQNIVHYKSQQSRLNIKYLIDYDDFCGVSHKKSKSLSSNPNKMKEVTVQELQKLKESGADFQLIDVREPHEFDICDLGGELIPQAEIPSNVDKIAKNKQVVIHCRSGARSGNMVQWLEKNHGFENLYNLKGGILAWAKEIDPTMPTY
ncbi:MAG TPA: molybdopterin-synthase adenylyltransferase MoeB [Chryseolinea sp.]|nr:molybdopterin-synthase adenylyltransferase MoeB [Chryseolinea sp.]HPM32560.1 molybdopterin-synthase adenylyltransferase MoeB [Chryseolinea sp.]